jgi:hypothetical protein
MLRIFVQKVERAKQLYFGRFDEIIHGLIKKTFHSIVGSKDSIFLNLGPWLFKGWPKNFNKAY